MLEVHSEAERADLLLTSLECCKTLASPQIWVKEFDVAWKPKTLGLLKESEKGILN